MKKLFTLLKTFKDKYWDSYLEKITFYNAVRLLAMVLFASLMIIVWLSLALNRSADSSQKISTQQFSFEQKSLALLGRHLNDVSVKLAAVQHDLQNAPVNKPVNITALETSLNRIQAAMRQASLLQRQVLEKDIAADNEAVQSKLTKISRQLSSIQQNQHAVTRLPASDLPFHVLHIDMIQAEPVVTVRYAHTDFPLLVGDSLAGFSLTSADFLHQSCVFQTKADGHTADIKIAFGADAKGNANDA